MQENRRKAKRYEAQWKVALVFGPAEKKPIFHTLTHDLSINGTSVQSAHDEKSNAVLNLLLIPPRLEGIEQKIIKLKGVVMSSRAFRNGFRLGVSFIHDAELEKLWRTLNALDLSGNALPSGPYEAESAPATGPATSARVVAASAASAAASAASAAASAASAASSAASVAAAAEQAPAAAGPASVLDMIKQRNLEKKKSDDQQSSSKEEQERLLFKRISDTLTTGYNYFNDLLANLNELKPEYTGTFLLANVPDIKELTWKEGARAGLEARTSVSGVKVFNQLGVSYTLANPVPLKFTRDAISAPKSTLALKENNIDFSEDVQRNAQGATTGVNFVLPRELRVRMTFTCDDATQKLKLETRNLERIGAMQFEFDLDGLNQALLDQLALMMLGERNTVGKLIRRTM